MTIAEALEKVDAIKPNSYTEDEKVGWLSELDGDTVTQFDEWYKKTEGDVYIAEHIIHPVKLDYIQNVNDPWFQWYQYYTEDEYYEPPLPYVVGIDVTDDSEESSSSAESAGSGSSGAEGDATPDSESPSDDPPGTVPPPSREAAPSLLIPFPYDAIYVTWLSMKIDYANGDIAKYNNGKMMFDEQYGAFMNWVNRRLVHKQTRISYIQ